MENTIRVKIQLVDADMQNNKSIRKVCIRGVS